MTAPHTIHEHGDHAEMGHGQHGGAANTTQLELDARADMSHGSPSENQPDTRVRHTEHAAHGMDGEGPLVQHRDDSGHEDMLRQQFRISRM